MAALRLRLGILASGGGSNLQAIIDACKSGWLDGEVRVVISNTPEAGALQRARAEGIPSFRLSSRTNPDPEDLDRAILRTLREQEVEWVILAGYLKKLGRETLESFRGRILNIHPALLPKFGGPGMYGQHVHQAVLAAGEKTTGASVHLVDEQYDHGEVIAQREVPVQEGDTPATLAARVLETEHALLIDTLRRISEEEPARQNGPLPRSR